MVAKWAEKGNLLEHVNAEPHVDRVKLVRDPKGTIYHCLLNHYVQLIGVARGMTYLHGSNPSVVHGDLKAVGIPCVA